MTISDYLGVTELPDPQAMLRTTDWALLGTARLTGGEFLSAVLAGLVVPDPRVRGVALDELEPVRHQNSL
ncbi:hypothetical protein ACFVSN_29310 [Kitasatospora sp. NPDC057904]|uniref:hypothetical protein n=1 Tax=unclassified Kitasatospora TaxID=2633591 RepID=UPI0036DCC6BF